MSTTRAKRPPSVESLVTALNVLSTAMPADDPEAGDEIIHAGGSDMVGIRVERAQEVLRRTVVALEERAARLESGWLDLLHSVAAEWEPLAEVGGLFEEAVRRSGVTAAVDRLAREAAQCLASYQDHAALPWPATGIAQRALALLEQTVPPGAGMRRIEVQPGFRAGAPGRARFADPEGEDAGRDRWRHFFQTLLETVEAPGARAGMREVVVTAREDGLSIRIEGRTNLEQLRRLLKPGSVWGFRAEHGASVSYVRPLPRDGVCWRVRVPEANERADFELEKQST